MLLWNCLHKCGLISLIMKEFFAAIFTLALIIAVVALILSLVKPGLAFNKKLFKTNVRKRLAVYYSALIIALFILIGIVAPVPNVTVNERLSNSAEDVAAVSQTEEIKSENPPIAEPELSDLYSVVKVVDGDTIDVSIDGKIERLRLIGIDTPETVDPRKPVQCFGKEASGKAKELLEGKKVRLESDDTQDNRDKYDRLLRYVYLEDGTLYNKTIIAEGYAHEYTYNLPYKYQSEFKQAQKDAEQAEKGLWAASTCGGDTEQSAQPQASPPSNQPAPSQSGGCDPNYSPCIPNVSYDLDCGDISTSVRVIGTDRHLFDRDGDGYGCESN